MTCGPTSFSSMLVTSRNEPPFERSVKTSSGGRVGSPTKKIPYATMPCWTSEPAGTATPFAGCGTASGDLGAGRLQAAPVRRISKQQNRKPMVPPAAPAPLAAEGDGSENLATV